MRGRFSKGMIIGSILGASVGMMMEGDGMRRRRRMMKNGRRLMRASSEVIDNITDMFR